jgi:hypothetical protein
MEMPEHIVGAQREMPRYQCHKQVWALKIKRIELAPAGAMPSIIPDDDGYGPIHVSSEWIDKHKPVVGGYYVVYDDSYVSFSPAEAFESGYTRI